MALIGEVDQFIENKAIVKLIIKAKYVGENGSSRVKVKGVTTIELVFLKTATNVRIFFLELKIWVVVACSGHHWIGK